MNKCCEKCFAKGVNLDLNVCLDGSCECHRPKECCKMLNKYQCSQSTDGCDCQCHNVSTPRPDSSSLPPQDLMRKPCEKCIDRTAYFNKVVCKQWECNCECHKENRGYCSAGTNGNVLPGTKSQDPQPSWEREFDEKFYSIEGQDSQGSHWIQGKNEPLELSGENGRDLGDVKHFIRTHFISRQDLKEKLASMKKTCIGPPKWMLSPQDKARNVALQDVEDFTMTYELAKQLKDAGFPQPTFEHRECDMWECCEHGYYYTEGERNDNPYLPTLSELIQATNLDALSRDVSKEDPFISGWRAWTGDGDGDAFGKTPEEAVKNLWLALNKKLL